MKWLGHFSDRSFLFSTSSVLAQHLKMNAFANLWEQNENEQMPEGTSGKKLRKQNIFDI